MLRGEIADRAPRTFLATNLSVLSVLSVYGLGMRIVN